MTGIPGEFLKKVKYRLAQHNLTNNFELTQVNFINIHIR